MSTLKEINFGQEFLTDIMDFFLDNLESFGFTYINNSRSGIPIVWGGINGNDAVGIDYDGMMFVYKDAAKYAETLFNEDALPYQEDYDEFMTTHKINDPEVFDMSSYKPYAKEGIDYLLQNLK